jgi:hypothetical protein
MSPPANQGVIFLAPALWVALFLLQSIWQHGAESLETWVLVLRQSLVVSHLASLTLNSLPEGDNIIRVSDGCWEN